MFAPSAASASPPLDDRRIFSQIVGREIAISAEKIEAVLWGVALGDALGLPVETWGREEIAGRFGVLRRF